MTEEKLHAIEEAIRNGESHWSISKKLNASVVTVDQIAAGEHHLQKSSEYVRCPGCGGKVTLPCRTCRARSEILIERYSESHKQGNLGTS